ncbi:MAG: HD domain-containing protein, partial [Candidatus Peribacteraceae bacterium]|nr:HD domain-containing protein [Candidatus Peribacteraceae bacterium]
EGVTKLDDEEIRAHPTLDEEIESLRKMITAMQKDVRLMVIKLADRLHNMRTISFLSPKRQGEFAQETLDIYVKIADRMSMQDFRDALEGLCLQILEPATFAQLQEQREQNKIQGEEIIDSMRHNLEVAEERLPEGSELRFEHKTWNHLRNRLTSPDPVVGKRSALTVVLLCDSVPQCYSILGILHQQWPHEILSFKDFISAPAVNRYRGLHTTVILPHGMRVRCKIRTREMHDYARKGITMFCFNRKTTGLRHFLPWAEHISPVSADTAQKSSEFWESLQNDILGRSILIYGPDGSAVQLPKGATALDGAFFLLKEKALRTESIAVNGIVVPFFTPLSQSVALSIVLTENRTLNRSWLEWVQTGFATATIRKSLGAESVEKKISQGRSLLEQAMIQQSRGYLSEFREQDILRGFESLGYTSLSQAYIAITDGHLDPELAVSAIFRPRSGGAPGVLFRQPCVITFSLSAYSLAIVERFLPIEKKYHLSINDFQIIPKRRKSARISFRCPLTPDEQRSIAAELRAAGAEGVSVSPAHSIVKHIFALVPIFSLWGLDPVFAWKLIHIHQIAALDLTIVRFLSLTGLGAFFLTWTTIRLPLRQARLPLKSLSFWTSALALLTVALSTYTSLQETPATHYTLLMTSAGVILTSIVHWRRWKTMILTWLLLVTGSVILIADSSAWSAKGVVTTLLAVGAFTLFSVASERYKRLEHVDVRAAQYFFSLSVVCAIGVLPFFLWSEMGQYAPSTLAQMILFSIVFTGLPYYIYYYVLSHQEIDVVMRFSFALIFVTLAGQMLIGGAVAWQPIALPLLLITTGALLPLLRRRPSPSM